MARRCESCPMLDRCDEITTGVCLMEDIDETMPAGDTAGSAGDDSSYLYEFIFEACEYFSSLGYICNSSEIFSVISDMHGGQMDVKKLLSAIAASDGKDTVVIYVENPRAMKQLGANQTVHGDEALLKQLEELFGEENVKLM